ncbi:hypothetical protein ACFIQF_22625 [Comamonas sp. J-3]|uniref:hypothetical protein n=1 Tax=Comamonas trifloxystrobinivorans TaxID=3350256 RepID=UPI003727E20B
MGYTKKWTPPTIPLRDNLPAWKALFTDLHQSLLDSGLVQTATAGQLVINNVAALPADTTFAGFIEYAFSDAMQATAPVIIKLEYGCGIEGMSGANTSYGRSRTPRIRCTISYKGSVVDTFQCPQELGNTGGGSNAQLISPGASFIVNAPESGFFAICYGAGSRNKPFSAGSGEYYGATLSLVLQRQLDNLGAPTADGLAIYRPSLTIGTYNSVWTTGLVERSKSVFANAGVVIRDDMAPRIGREGLSATAERVLMEPINYPGIPAQPFPFLVSYRATDIAAGSEFSFTPVVGPARNFVALGNETCFSPDNVDGHRAGVAMLFE